MSDQPTASPEQTTPAAETTPADASPPAPEAAVEAAPAVAPKPQRQPDAKSGGYFWGTGRRKTAVARVRIRPGEGKFLVNKREIDAYFCADRDRADVLAPLKASKAAGKYDVFVTVGGGGPTGQAGAVMLGVARALLKADPDLEGVLREGDYLTRDARKVERKKPGQPGARKRFQFSKR